MGGKKDNNSLTNLLPLFCIQAEEMTTSRKLFIKYYSSKDVDYPPVDFDEKAVIELALDEKLKAKFNDCAIPFKSSPLFWTDDGKRNYVIHIVVNDRFARCRVINSQQMISYLNAVAMSQIEEKYNSNTLKNIGEFVGHKVVLNYKTYFVTSSFEQVKASSEMVNNKVSVVEDKLEQIQLNDATDKIEYDLYYRPSSKLLTCSLQTERLPSSVAFNDDRIIVKLEENILLDTYLPFFIDLGKPVMYKFFDKTGIFKIIFKTNEALDM